jgi:hypothetical protein
MRLGGRGGRRAFGSRAGRGGYRRLHVLLKREGYVINHKKLFRLYRKEKLAVRRRGGRKRAIGTRAPMLVPMAPNDRWSLDFVSDQLTDGRRFRIVTVVDDCTRECLALVADTSLSGVRVARELDRLMIERGKPKMVVSDNGSELTSNAILTWADHTQSRIYNAPGGSVTRCPAGDSGCTIYNAPDNIQDRINQGKRDVQDADSPLDKVKEVGKTLIRDCMNCGMDAVRGAVNGEAAR